MRRPLSRNETKAGIKALVQARARGFARTYSLDTLLEIANLWVEPDSLRAKLLEFYEPKDRYGLVFAPDRPPFKRGGYHITEVDTTEGPLVTVVIALPQSSISAAVKAPDPVTALLTIEVARLKAAGVLPEVKLVGSFKPGEHPELEEELFEALSHGAYTVPDFESWLKAIEMTSCDWLSEAPGLARAEILEGAWDKEPLVNYFIVPTPPLKHLSSGRAVVGPFDYRGEPSVAFVWVVPEDGDNK